MNAGHHLQAILDNMPSLIAYWDRQQRNRFANHAYRTWLGLDPDRMPGMHLREVIGEERYHLNLPYIEGVLRGEKQEFERLVSSPDGRVRDTLAQYIPDIVDNEVRGFYVMVSDITAIKAAEQAFRESEERYRRVVDDQTELIGRYTPDGNMIFVNEVYCRFFGKTETELRGHSWRPVAHPDDIAMIEQRLSTLSPANPVVTIENRVYAADGREHWMQFVNRAFFDEAGRMREIQSVGRDISVRKQVEQELAASRQQLHALLEANDHLREVRGKEIAHEIHDQLGALLTAIGFRIDALNHQLPRNSPASAELARIKSLLAQASGATRDICNNLRPPVLDDLGLIPACRWYLNDWSRLVAIPAKGRFGKLSAELSERLSTDLFRVFQELLNNIAKHSGATAVRVGISSGAQSLRLHVADNGGGFPGNSRQIGLGLLGIRERMARYGGQVAIVSGATGTSVTISIPWASVK